MCDGLIAPTDSETAKAMMKDYHIGFIDSVESEALLAGEQQSDSDDEPAASFLNSRIWKKATLLSKVTVSWDTRIFKFKLEHEYQSFGMPVGQHAMIRLRDPATREVVIRSYTPISEIDQKGEVDVLVKVYFDTKERKGGKMSQAIDALPIGHFADFKGPIGKFEYFGAGRCVVNGKAKTVNSFVMISGGSGITPMYQVLRAIMQDKQDRTRCVLLDGNRLVEDILCKDELDALAKDNVDKFQLYHTLTQASDDWEGLRGRIAAPLLKKHASKAAHSEGGKAMVLICGPDAMQDDVYSALLGDGWAEDDLHIF